MLNIHSPIHWSARVCLQPPQCDPLLLETLSYRANREQDGLPFCAVSGTASLSWTLTLGKVAEHAWTNSSESWRYFLIKWCHDGYWSEIAHAKIGYLNIWSDMDICTDIWLFSLWLACTMNPFQAFTQSTLVASYMYNWSNLYNFF